LIISVDEPAEASSTKMMGLVDANREQPALSRSVEAAASTTRQDAVSAPLLTKSGLALVWSTTTVRHRARTAVRATSMLRAA